MNSTQISSYWQAYLDLIELWAKGIWDEADLAAHFHEHGQSEGRQIVDLAAKPADWSDWLYFTNSHDAYQWWWRKGVIDSGIYAGLVEGHNAMQRGSVSKDPHLLQIASMSPKALEQLAENAKEHPGTGPLAALSQQNMQWGAQKSIGLLPMEDAIRAKCTKAFDYVIVVPWLESGGGELVGLWHYLAARDLGLQPLLLLADQANVTERFVAHNPDILNLPELYEQTTGTVYRDLPREDREQVLTMALEVLSPQKMHLIHSFIGYSALLGKPTRQRIRAACGKIFVSAFCPHIHSPGNYDGYFRYIPEIDDVVDRFIFDNDWYLNEMRGMYQVADEKTSALKYPIDALAPVQPSPRSRPKVLWASRFDSQKNPNIVGKIAARLPDIDFVLYGRRVLGDDEMDWDAMPRNVTDGGEFFSIDALPIAECFAFLYTSKFDGTPNILMEIASRGLPIITPNIGGIAGFLGDDWPAYVGHPEDVEGFVAHLAALSQNKELAAQLRDIQIEILKNERSFDAFKNAVDRLIKAS